MPTYEEELELGVTVDRTSTSRPSRLFVGMDVRVGDPEGATVIVGVDDGTDDDHDDTEGDVPKATSPFLPPLVRSSDIFEKLSP